MPNLYSPPAYRASMAALAVAVDTARRLRHIDAREPYFRLTFDPFEYENARLRLEENRKVRALAWAAHRRLWGVLTD